MSVADRKTAALLNGMADGMPQIEQLPLAPILFVPDDNIAFNAHAAGNHRFALLIDRFLQGIKEFFITQDAVFDGLGTAVPKDAVRQGVQCAAVAQHQRRLMKCAGQIFSLRKVDRCFAAHR